MSKIPDEILRALGRVVINFQYLDMRLSATAARLISNDPEVGNMAIFQLSFGKKCDLIESLFLHIFGKLDSAKQFQEIIKEIGLVEQERNKVFHSAWAIEKETGETFRVKADLRKGKGLVVATPTVAAEDIDSLADEISRISIEFAKIVNTVFTDY